MTHNLLSTNSSRLQIPGGGLSEVSSCSAQYQQSSTVWGSTPEGLAAGQDCENLPQELRDGCLWRFGWFADTLNPT